MCVTLSLMAYRLFDCSEPPKRNNSADSVRTWTRFPPKDFLFLLILIWKRNITHTPWLLDLWLKGSLKGGARILLWRFIFLSLVALFVWGDENLSSRKRGRKESSHKSYPATRCRVWTIRSGRGVEERRNVSWNTVARHAEKPKPPQLLKHTTAG